jgi:hypothetical protein
VARIWLISSLACSNSEQQTATVLPANLPFGERVRYVALLSIAKSVTVASFGRCWGYAGLGSQRCGRSISTESGAARTGSRVTGTGCGALGGGAAEPAAPR